MLSKVLSGVPSEQVELLVFPQAFGNSGLGAHSNQSRGPDESEHAEEIARLRNEISQLRAAAAQSEKQAFSRGHQQGQEEAHAELQPVLQRLNSSILEVAGLRSQLRKSAERDVVQLSLAIAKRVLHRELQMDESALGALARFAFDRMGRAERYQILVHPRFAPFVEQSLPRRQDVSIRVEADPGCAPGTLVIRTENGALDASIDHQLEEISKGLVDRIA